MLTKPLNVFVNVENLYTSYTQCG